MVKIRLARIGRHKDPFYRIVAADSRSSRDGRYIEQIGTFDPNLKENAADINEELALKWLNLGATPALGEEKALINEELAMKWLKNGAIPSDSVRAMFSRKGIMAKFAEGKAKKESK